MRRTIFFVAAGAAALALAGTALLSSAPGPTFTVHDKAYYADPNLVNFVRPGLVVKIRSAAIAADGTITVRLRLSDPKDVPLDREGVTTPGAISLSFIAAYIPKGKTQHVAYTVRSQRSPITGVSADQAGSDTNGAWTKVADGEYEYKFGTRAPQGFDKTTTHTIGVYGSRNLTEFDLGTSYDNAVFNFVPDGSKVTVIRDVITTESCNKCHHTMAFHGGSRRKMELCVLCHQPQTIDPDTGNTVDMPVMIHRIHQGAGLPSVKAGKKYQIIGNSQSVHDYSGIVFPADVRRCVQCHEQSGPRAASQAKNLFAANRAACGACHDDINFATGTNHANQPQVSDSQCTHCHVPQGELDFDASILGAHTIPTFSRELPGVVFNILSVDDAGPGKRPTVVYTIKDKKGNVIKPSEMARLSIHLVGPNTDYADFPGTSAGYQTDTATGSLGDGKTLNWWTMSRALPGSAKGSWTVAIEGRRELTIAAGTVNQQTGVRDHGDNVQFTFSVDGGKPQPRRRVVATEKCNFCHGALSGHGGARNDAQQCAICHNTNLTGSAGAGKPNSTVDFRMMVHRIHTGEELTREYRIGNANFNEVAYPGDRRKCDACHVSGSEQLPIAAVRNVNDPGGYLTSVPPITAACTSCHDSKAATAHAATNTSASQGEACATCHGPAGEYSINRVHAR
jgi:OmcA/MtrC family decaheme c-type cytochrome